MNRLENIVTKWEIDQYDQIDKDTLFIMTDLNRWQRFEDQWTHTNPFPLILLNLKKGVTLLTIEVYWKMAVVTDDCSIFHKLIPNIKLYWSAY